MDIKLSTLFKALALICEKLETGPKLMVSLRSALQEAELSPNEISIVLEFARRGYGGIQVQAGTQGALVYWSLVSTHTRLP